MTPATLIRRGCQRSEGHEVFQASRPAAFLDRDGVLNVDRTYVARQDDFEWIPGALAALKLLREFDFLVVVVTNQSGIGRGYYTEDAFLELTCWMMTQAEFDAVYYCPHTPEINCPARKPNPGMLARATKDFNIELTNSFLIGDKPSDVEAARAFGVEGYLFDQSNLLEFVEPLVNCSRNA